MGVENGADVISYSAGSILIDSFESTSSQVEFEVSEYKDERAFKPASIVIYLDVNVSLFAPTVAVLIYQKMEVI